MNVTDRRTDRQTHRHRMTAKPALDASHRAAKMPECRWYGMSTECSVLVDVM